FIEYIRKRIPVDLAASGASLEEVEQSKHLFDPNTLTLGFARRFATYKRPNLLLHDTERLLRIFSLPVQLVIAGKAHPADIAGQALIEEWVNFSRRTEVKSKIIFLSDYDMFLTGQMVQGVDVWLNTPRRPWEASGTSGMKALVNGVINLSELDGWWDEAYEPGVGWALGDGKEHGDNPEWDAAEANQLYNLLENEVIPEFYTLNEKGIPLSWTAKMRRSMAELTPRFSTNRTIKEYTEQYYLPAADAYKKRSAANGEAGTQIINRKHALRENWEKINLGAVQIDKAEHGYTFHIPVFMQGFSQDEVKVELYANGINGSKPVRIKMEPVSPQNDGQEEYLYHANVDETRDVSNYTVRMIPNYEGISVPLEDNLILWQR
ncbi:MAG: alpha-glucan family phosphorylase, partial [Chitinophagaceae bacterium]